MKRLLIVSPHFPPVNAPDMQRARMSLPGFVAAGWEVTVLTVDDPTPMAPVEPELLATIPPAVRIVCAGCFSRRWTGRLGVNNLGWRALPFVFWTGLRLLRRERFDVVYFSTTQFVVIPLGRVWRWLFGAAYVLDLQDPWVSDFHDRPGPPRPPGGWKYRVAQFNARCLEGWTLRRAAHVFSVSDRYLADLRTRHAWFDTVSSSVLTFGAPTDDLTAARRPAGQPPLLPAGASLKIAYAGRLGADMLPALEILFAALAAARPSRPIELFFFGTSYAAASEAQSTTTALAARHGVQALVHESPARIGYLDSLRLLDESDVTLILGSADHSYSPSKIYPTLLAGKPTLAVVPAGSVLEEKLAELGGAHVAAFPPERGAQAHVVAELADCLRRCAGEPLAPRGSPLRRELLAGRYSAAAVATAQLAVFDRIARGAAEGATP